MASGHTTSGSTGSSAKRGGHRVLGVKVWLGAGALAVGVGAAVAGASGVASADTGGHHDPGSASASKHESTSTAGPKRTVGAAPKASLTSPKQVKAQAVKATAAADTSDGPGLLHKAAASPSAALSTAAPIENNQTVDTPFGPITLTTKLTIPDLGTNGPLSLEANATTSIGNVAFSLAGTQTFSTSPLVSETAITSGTFVAPAPVAFLASAAGSVIAGGLAAYGSVTAIVSALQTGNLVGALLTSSTIGVQFVSGFLFGSETLTLPLELPGTGLAIALHVPVSGIFGPVRSISVTVPAYSYVDTTTGALIKLDAADFELAGTKLGGVAGKLIGQ